MNPIFIFSFIIIVFLSFVIRTIRNIFYQIFLWQLKEYRIDRFFSHLKTDQGRKLLFGPLSSIKWILLLFIVAGILYEYNYLFNVVSFDLLFFLANLGFGFIWIIEAVLYLKELVSRWWRIPKFTLKTVSILIIILIFQFSPLVFSGNIIQQLILGPFLDKLLTPSVAFLIILINIPYLIIKKIILLFAKFKISQFYKLIVVGITGSYGKTSTKEFLTTILSENFKVTKTPEFTNTDIGIANYILKELKASHEIFVVEMGAYKKGEIKEICDIVRPKIGIITGINEQHLELFGSIENTMKTKFELIESLPKKGVAIFNGNNRRCLEMAKWAETLGLKTIIFKTRADVKNIKQFKNHIEFNFTFENKNYLLKANLLGVQTIENILGAIYAAKSLGLSITEIQKGVAKITSPAQTMQIVGSKRGSRLVDDAFNANPDGVVAALDYMKLYKGKKILILTPLIELGEAADKIHAQIGKKAAEICDLILLTNINYHKSFIAGVTKVSDEDKVQVVNTMLAVKLIKENLGEDGVVVFEGKEAARVLKQLKINN